VRARGAAKDADSEKEEGAVFRLAVGSAHGQRAGEWQRGSIAVCLLLLWQLLPEAKARLKSGKRERD